MGDNHQTTTQKGDNMKYIDLNEIATNVLQREIDEEITGDNPYNQLPDELTAQEMAEIQRKKDGRNRCVWCGQIYNSTNPSRKYCGERCRKLANGLITEQDRDRIKEANEMVEHRKRGLTWGEIGKLYGVTDAAVRQRIMTHTNVNPGDIHRDRRLEIKCSYCGNVFISKSKSAKYCTESCSRRYHNQVKKKAAVKHKALDMYRKGMTVPEIAQKLNRRKHVVQSQITQARNRGEIE